MNTHLGGTKENKMTQEELNIVTDLVKLEIEITKQGGNVTKTQEKMERRLVGSLMKFSDNITLNFSGLKRALEIE
jgi:hypothetical protein